MVNVFLRAPGELALSVAKYADILVMGDTAPIIFDTCYCGCPVLQQQLTHLGINVILVTDILELHFLCHVATELYLVEDTDYESPRFSVIQKTNQQKETNIMSNVQNVFVNIESDLGQQLFEEKITSLVTLPIDELVSPEHENYADNSGTSVVLKNWYDLDCTLLTEQNIHPLVEESRVYLMQSALVDGIEELTFLLVGTDKPIQEEDGVADPEIAPSREEILPIIPSPVETNENGFNESDLTIPLDNTDINPDVF